jgi:hypothetical protein
VEHSRRRLEGVTGAQLLAFIRVSGYCAALGLEEPAAWQEVAAGLAARGVPGAWSAEPGLEQAGHWLAGRPVQQVWEAAQAVARHFLPEAAVAVAALSLLGAGLGGSRAGARPGGPTVSREQAVGRAEVVLRLAGEGDREGPCGELAAAVAEGLSRLERAEGLGREEAAMESQHEEGRWTRRIRRQLEVEDWGEERGFRDSRLAVGGDSTGEPSMATNQHWII